MKGVWTRAGIAALAVIMIANAFVPYAFALSIASPAGEESASKEAEFFTIESGVLDFGRINEPGRSYTKAIVVKNNTANDVIVDASTSVYADAAESNQELTGWIAFVGGMTHFNIAAGASREVNVRVIVPAGAPAGTQYSNIELIDANAHKEVVLVKIDVAGDGLKYDSEVVDSYIEPIRLDDTLVGRATVKNTGTAGFSSVYQIRAKSVFGGMDWEMVEQAEEEVFPGKQVEFRCDNQLGFGIYSVEQRVTFANAEGRMVESFLSRTVINLPWLGLAIAGGVLFLIIFILVAVKCRKRSKKDQDRLRRAERKLRKAEIARVERAEGKALEKGSRGSPH